MQVQMAHNVLGIRSRRQAAERIPFVPLCRTPLFTMFQVLCAAIHLFFLLLARATSSTVVVTTLSSQTQKVIATARMGRAFRTCTEVLTSNVFATAFSTIAVIAPHQAKNQHNPNDEGQYSKKSFL